MFYHCFLRSLLSSERHGILHLVCHSLLLSWKIGKLPVLGRELYQQRLQLPGERHSSLQVSKSSRGAASDKLNVNLSAAGNFGGGNLAHCSPCKTWAGREPLSPRVQPGWLERVDPSQLREVAARFRYVGQHHPHVSSDLTGARRSADNRPTDLVSHSGIWPPLSDLQGGCCNPSSVYTQDKDTPTAPISHRKWDGVSARSSCSWLLAAAEIKTIRYFSPPTPRSNSSSQNISQQKCYEQKKETFCKHLEGVGWFSYIIEYLFVSRTVFHCSSWIPAVAQTCTRDYYLCTQCCEPLSGYHFSPKAMHNMGFWFSLTVEGSRVRNQTQ